MNTALDFLVDECRSDSTRVAVPSTSLQLVARFGPHVPGGFDIHALGPWRKIHRKWIRGGQRTVFARLPMGSYHAVLGKPAAAFTGRIVALRDLWDAGATERLEEQLAGASDADAAVSALKSAISPRLQPNTRVEKNTRLALIAARRLETQNVTSVAKELGVSERHLRRVFHEAVGLSPKAFSKLLRFERAVKAAKDGEYSSWSDLAVGAGYHDQAHLIADFRSIAEATPREFLSELRGCSSSAA